MLFTNQFPGKTEPIKIPVGTGRKHNGFSKYRGANHESRQKSNSGKTQPFPVRQLDFFHYPAPTVIPRILKHPPNPAQHGIKIWRRGWRTRSWEKRVQRGRGFINDNLRKQTSPCQVFCMPEKNKLKKCTTALFSYSYENYAQEMILPGGKIYRS